MKNSLSEWFVNITPWILVHGIKILLIGIAAFLVMRGIRRVMPSLIRKAVVSRKFTSKQAEIKRENTLIRIMTLFSRVVVALLAGMMMLSECGVPITPLLASAGVAGLAIGFGGQYLVRDLVTGLFIIMENQYRVGDVVNFDGTSGEVKDITLRMTTLQDMNGTFHHVPHGEIKKVSNMTENFQKINLDVTLAYNCDIDKVIEIINEIGQTFSKDPQWSALIKKAPSFLRVDNFGEHGMVIKIVGETEPLALWDVTGELRKRIIQVFYKNKIEIVNQNKIEIVNRTH